MWASRTWPASSTMTTFGVILYVGESTSSAHAIGLTDREEGDELRSAFGFDEVRLFLQLSTDLELRTGSSTRNEVGFTEKPTSTLHMTFISN
jgi:hypothetical protein